MKRHYFFHLFILACVWHTPSFAQVPDVKFKRISIHEGLSSAVVLAAVKDHQGFLWFGTFGGLNRYDGYQFRVFINDPQDSTSISDDWINCLRVSRTGDIWIGTQGGGLNRYERSTGRFFSYKHHPNDSTSLTDNNVTSLCEDAAGTLWIGTARGGLCWIESSRKVGHHSGYDSPVLSEINKTPISTVLADVHGDLWVGTVKGLYRLPKGEKFSDGWCRCSAQQDRSQRPGRTDAVKSLYEDARGTLYVGLTEGLFIYDRASDRLMAFTTGKSTKMVVDKEISCLREDRAGRLWVGTAANGLYLLDRERERCQSICANNSEANCLSSNAVFSMCEDDAGTMWFGTYEGISSYDKKQKPFSNYLFQAKNPNGLSSGDILDVREDADGGLWIATHGGGLNYRPYGSRDFTHYRHVPTNPMSLSTDLLLCMSGNREGVLWIGSRGGGLMRFDRRTKKTKRFFHDPNDPASLSENTIFYIYEDRKENLWIGTAHEGVDKLDPATEKFVHYRTRSGDSTSVSGNSIWAIVEDSKGFIWIGTQRAGLNRLDPRTGRSICYMNRPGDPNSIQSNSIYALHEYPEGVLWIGTAGGGLNRFDAKTDKFTAYTKKDGLSGNHVCSILHDTHGRLWLAAGGLTMFDPQTKKIKNFFSGDGIACGSLNQEAASVGRDGRIYFGGSDGFVVFHPDSIYDNTYIPPIVLTDFKVFEDSRILPEDTTAGIILSYEEDYFSFEFAALSFTAPEKNMYRYMLEGYDRDWISCGTRRYAAYTHVDPGDYVFRVHGSNDDGVWNTTGTAVPVHVIPPYWKTWWFRLSAVSIIVFAATFIIRRRFKFLEQRTKDQQELSRQLLESQENERKRIGVGLHDSLGQNLLVIKNLAVMGLEEGKKKKAADEQLGEISDLASQALAEVREISYNLRPHHLDQLGLTGALKSIISRISASSQLTIHDDLDDVDNLFPKQEEINVFRIVQESVNNIVKHSRATGASITVKREMDHMTLTISDNGTGFDPRRRGFGLTGMAERARILGGTLEVKSLPGDGTSIRVTIPVKETHAER